MDSFKYCPASRQRSHRSTLPCESSERVALLADLSLCLLFGPFLSLSNQPASCWIADFDRFFVFMGSSFRVHPLKSPGELIGRTHSEAVSSLIPNDERNSLRSNDQNRMSDTITVPISSGQRDTVNRLGAKCFYEPGMDLEDGKAEKEQDSVKIQSQALVSGLAYCTTSISMILVNKLVLSGYDFNAGISLMLYQNLVSVTIVSSLSLFNIISTEPLTWKLVKVWLPVNVIFIGMLITSMFSLRYMNVAMVTILKNVTNVITALGETYIFMKRHDKKVWTALCLMIVSAISGGMTDLSFHAVGYSWQIANCFLTAAYSLTLRWVMDSAKQVTKSGNLNEFSMVLLNNTLSLPLGIVLMFASEEVQYLYETPLLRMPMFWLVITLSGILGLAISFTSLWFLHQTSATTYSLVGSLNKIPLSIAGLFLFNVRTSMQNLLSILFGLLAGIFFAKAKLR